MTVPEYDVSVVIPAYRMEETIIRAIRSILAQPGIRPEVVVVVDASPDHTAAKARSFNNIVVLVNERNMGASASRNRGLAMTNAPFVMFLDADDYVEGPLLHSLRDAILDVDSDLAFGPSALEWPDGRRKHQLLPSCQNSAAIITEWLSGCYVPPCAVLWRRTILNQIGGWNESTTKNQDGEIVFRAICSGARITTSKLGLGIYYQHASDHRISTQNSQASLESRDSILEYIISELQGRDSSLAKFGRFEVDRLQHAIAKEYYFCAIHAFDGGFASMGNLYLSKARRLGFHGHTGSAINGFLIRIIGLRRVRILKNALKKLLVRLGNPV